MKSIRVGEKIISRERIMNTVDNVLERRAAGMSQQEVATALQLDRSFISRLETIGELRKGGRIALVGFPVSNKEELTKVANDYGIDYVFLMTEKERWAYAGNKDGIQLINEIMALLATIRTFDTVIMIGSDFRIKFTEAMIDRQVIPIFIGESPIKEDKYVDPEVLKELLCTLRS